MTGIETHLKRPLENKSWLPLAVLAGLLICVGLTVGFFINNSTNKSTQIQISPPIIKPNENLAPPPRVLNLPPQNTDFSVLKNAEQAKVNSVSAEQVVERVEVSEEPIAGIKKIEKPKSSPLENESARPVIIVGKPRRNAPQNQTRPRVIVSDDVPDVEVIFTGRRNERVRYEKKDKENRGKNNNDDWKENRRGREPEGKKRGKAEPFPF